MSPNLQARIPVFIIPLSSTHLRPLHRPLNQLISKGVGVAMCVPRVLLRRLEFSYHFQKRKEEEEEEGEVNCKYLISSQSHKSFKFFSTYKCWS